MYFWVLIGLVTAAAAFDYKSLSELNHDTWWGPGGSRRDDTRITRMRIAWPKEVTTDLVRRLNYRRPYTPTLEGTNYNYGLNTATLDYWIDYWANEYNFTQREAYMNQYPHYKTQIQGLNIHFIHIKPHVPKGQYRIPILILHGFPGSVREFYEAIKHLTKASRHRNFVPELIIPSLPGFGYSDATNRPGLGAAEMTFIFRELMHRLGHKKYFIQGGDWGSIICQIMATFFQDEILGYHSNMGFAFTSTAYALITTASVYPEAIVPEDLVSRLYPLTTTLQYYIQEFGYFHIQSAKPDVLGVCVEQSPTSLAAWFLHLFSVSTGIAMRDDPMGGADMFTRDEFIDNLMMYWVPKKITTAFRIYAETFNLRNYRMGYLEAPTSVPTVVVQAARELFYTPPPALTTKFSKLVAVEPLDDYGHFLALEAPEVFSEMVLSGFQKIIEYREMNNMTFYKQISC